MAYANVYTRSPYSFRSLDFREIIASSDRSELVLLLDSPDATIRLCFDANESAYLYQKLVTLHNAPPQKGG